MSENNEIKEPLNKNYKVPKLRFPEFYTIYNSQTISSIFKLTGGGTPSTKEEKYWLGTMPWISSSDLIEFDINKISETRFISNEAIENSATKIVPAFSILVVTRVGLGKVAVNEHPICTSQDFTNLYSNNINPYYFAYLIQKHLSKKVPQGSTIKGISSKELAKMNLTYPTKNEQDKIYSFLHILDKKIDVINSKIAILKKYKEGILFKYKKEANKNGKILKLASICSLISGYNFNTNDYIINGNFDIVTIRNVMDDRYIDGDYKHVNFIPKSYVKLSKGDLLISMTGNVGRCSYVNDNNKLLNQRLCKFECEDTNKKFIYMITKTNSFKKRMNILAQGGAQPNLKNNDILNYIFLKIEDKLIHKNYVEAFDKTDQLLEQSKCLTKTLKRLKRILLNQLFI